MAYSPGATFERLNIPSAPTTIEDEEDPFGSNVARLTLGFRAAAPLASITLPEIVNVRPTPHLDFDAVDVALVEPYELRLRLRGG